MSARQHLARAYRAAQAALDAALDDFRGATWADVAAAERQRDEARDGLMAHLFEAHVDAHGLKHAGFLSFLGYGRYNAQIAYFADDSDRYRVTFMPTLSDIKSITQVLNTVGDCDMSRQVWTKGAA